ncbi:amidase [Ramlibacter sp. RBP-2]|uniref:Amidase n=1 Tax=Ramlibacter lithotrophicus TaxID=2606681 RepID=A0A7X6DJH2_9BURK|nr:amidase [Ramlibacter lithotrophicus]NKE68308.1 amidase [Ramlibacter lithotrophicus]
MRPNEMTASSAAEAIRRGELTSEQLVAGCLERIAEVEARVGAWTWLDPDHALAQARAADARQRAGAALGALHGIPVGIKDIFDTADMPTEDGTVLHAGRRPAADATAVALLRAAGAVIMGKTVTAELAVYAPGKTTNPHDPRRTPGGSSSGSAAAVAANMVPLAIGTQTNGSVLRPASYCGVHGFKPSHGSISRHGVLKQSLALDHVGVFARSVDDVALIARELLVHDGKDPDVPPHTSLALDDWRFAGGRPPRIAFVRTPQWPQASGATQDAFASLAAQWSDFAHEVELPREFGSAVQWHRTIMETDLASSFAAEYASGKDRLSSALREMIERGQRHLAVDYSRALDGVAALRLALARLFSEWDAVLTPATQGVAPLGLESTGSPMFCTIWTLCGVPAISLPMLRGEDGMPLGAQLVAARGDDANLLRIAKWLEQRREGARP